MHKLLTHTKPILVHQTMAYLGMHIFSISVLLVQHKKRIVFWNLVRAVSCKSGNTAAYVGNENVYRLVQAKSTEERQLTWKTEKEMVW